MTVGFWEKKQDISFGFPSGVGEEGNRGETLKQDSGEGAGEGLCRGYW